MNYYFDVKLNFLNKVYNYYEWDLSDNILDVKKIPIIKLSFSDFTKLFTHKVSVSDEFLEKIKNKTITSQGPIMYCAIFTDSNNSLAVIFDENNASILYSALSYSDELNIEEVCYKIKKEKIDFYQLENLKFSTDLRFDEKIFDTVKKDINKLINDKNYMKLNYLYNEVYKVNEKDIDSIISKFLFIDNFCKIDLYKFYEILKVHYKSV